MEYREPVNTDRVSEGCYRIGQISPDRTGQCGAGISVLVKAKHDNDLWNFFRITQRRQKSRLFC